MSREYVFSRVYPPLMEDYDGDIYSVSDESLRQLVGVANWVTRRGVDSRGVHLRGEEMETRFELTRYYYWTLFVPPAHFSEDITKTVTIISGVSEIQKHSMERSLEASAGASGFGLSSSVKASLKITDQTTREWHKEQREETEQKFRAGHSYCTWMLIDELILKKTVQRMLGGKASPIDPRPVISSTEMSCIMATYQDKWEDTRHREVSLGELGLQAVPESFVAEPMTLPTGKLKN